MPAQDNPPNQPTPSQPNTSTSASPSTSTKPEPHNDNGGIPGFAIFLIVLLILLLLAYGAWVLWSRRRASSQGLPPPSLNPFSKRNRDEIPFPQPRRGGVLGWFSDRIAAVKNRKVMSGAGYETGRSGGGGYGDVERGAGGAGGARGRRLDPDEAWDSNVGNEAYYEEQELGLHAPGQGNTAYGGSGYGAPGGLPSSGLGAGGAGAAGARGLSPSPYAGAYDSTYDLGDDQRERGRSRTREGGDARNPFGDAAEPSNLSLRGVSPRPYEPGSSTAKGKKEGDSPTERRSMFREDV